MRKWMGLLAAMVVCAITSDIAASAQSSEVVKRGKQATVFVEIHGPDGRSTGSATAFCIDGSGLFATNDHVVEHAAGGKVTLILNPGEATQRVVDATVLSRDPENDLALVQAGSGRFSPLSLGSTAELVETAPLTSFGYPLGKDLSLSQEVYPSITVSVGRVTALRKSKGVLTEIQVDTLLNPGNSGGPLIDNEGRVIAIAKSIIPGAALSFAVPVERLKTLLSVPGLAFSPANVPFDTRFEAREMSVTVRAFASLPKADYTVELTLPGIQAPRRFMMRPAGVDRYTATAALLEPGNEVRNEVAYTLTVRNGKQVARESKGIIALSGLVTSEVLTANITPPQLDSDRVSVKLPAPVDNVILGGGGRYLVLEMRRLRQLAIFDVNAGKIVSYLPMASDNIRIAAGLDRFVVLIPESKQIERWNFWTMKQEVVTTLQGADPLYAVALGYASSGPLMIVSRKGPTFLDLNTLELIDLPVPNIADWQGRLDVRASADGKTFAAFSTARSAPGIRVMTLTGTGSYRETLEGPVIPSADGSLFCLDRGLFDASLRPLAPPPLAAIACLPSASPGYFAGFKPAVAPAAAAANSVIEGPSMEIYSAADRRSLFTIKGLDELASTPAATSALERRVFWIPPANLLITLNARRDELILRKVPAVAELEKARTNNQPAH